MLRTTIIYLIQCWADAGSFDSKWQGVTLNVVSLTPTPPHSGHPEHLCYLTRHQTIV